MVDRCGYGLSSGSHSTNTCTKLSRAFYQNAVRQDFVFPPGWAAIPPGELPPSGGGRHTQGGPNGHRGGQRHGKGGGRGGGTGTSFLNTIHQVYASSGPPGYAPSCRPGYASFNYGDYRDDQCGRSPFRQSDPAIAVNQATITATTAKTAGAIAKTAGLTAPTKTTGASAAAAIPCTTTGAIVAAATVRRQPTKATPNRHPPPSVAKGATRRAALP
ncbi:hypothetical protein DYB35_006021, partial [Aphanomyces astaci]